MQRALPAILLVAVACTGDGAPGASGIDLAIRNVTVIDATGAAPRPAQTILVSGNRIRAIVAAAEAQVPRGVTAVDATGTYVIPGLWDMHSHVTMFGPTALSLYLANGVTGVRDMGAERFATAKAWRDSIATGTLSGPRMLIASPVLENARWLAAVQQLIEQAGTPWTLYERFGPTTVGDAVHWVDSVADLGADHIKGRNWPIPEITQAIITRARERGLPVVGHGNQPFPRTGLASVEHGIWPPLEGSIASRDSLWRHFASEGTAVNPTLVTWPIRLDPPDTLLAKLDRGAIEGTRYVPTGALTTWRNQLNELKQETGEVDWHAVYRTELRNVAEMAKAGVTLVAGSDIGAPLLVPGFSMHDELSLLVRVAGLTPMAALQAATRNAAAVMRIGDSLGTVEPGKIADLVILSADPLADIGNTRRIHAVVRNGRLLDRAALDRLLADSEAAAKSSP